jgi:glycine/D-amino acid oxidase-like deaminating enzyme
MTSLPILIIGQGLAGTALAWRLFERGLRFVIVDRDEPITASKIAAGLVTPITGMRLSLSWRYETFYPEALRFYRIKERLLGRKFYHRVPIATLLRDERSVAHWQKRQQQPGVRRFVREPVPLVNEQVFANPLGGFEQRHSGWLDAAAFLKASRDFFERQGCWKRADITPDDLTLHANGVTWNGELFRHAVFCNGWEAAKQPWFDWVPFQSARGTVLRVQADTQGEKRIVNHGCWLLPHADGSLRVGPTYEWSFDEAHSPSPEALAGLQAKLHTLLKVDFQVTDSQTAVRPIIKGCEALLGRHPARPQIAFFNGLGSKGVLRSPWLARHLLEHLQDGSPLEPELDLARNLR